MLNWLAPYVIFVVYRVLQWTWKVRVIESPEVQELIKTQSPFIIAHWHGDEMGIFFLLRRYKVACMVSTSKDGAIMNKLIHLNGAKTSRGSSTRQGTQALKGILRLAKEGHRPSAAVDGPKGPIHKVKPGVFQISRLTKLPIIPMSFASSNAFVFEKSWNKGELPKPFSRVTVYLGPPFPAVLKNQDSHDPDLANRLAQALHDTKKHAKIQGGLQ